MGPVMPRLSARSGGTTPMPTVRCFQMRLSVSRVSYSSTQAGKRFVKSSMKSSSEPLRFWFMASRALAFLILLTLYCGMESGRSRYTPPGRKYAACMRAPETASYMSNRSSRSRKV
ncbi:hypothetical protein D3C72_1972770 [compost metagenome]